MAEKKHCQPCNKDISITNWSKHLLTKVHSKNVSLRQNENLSITDPEIGADLLAQPPKTNYTIPDDLIYKIGNIQNVIILQTFKKATFTARVNFQTKNIEKYLPTLTDIIQQIVLL